jgi:hypothetical protein
MTLKTKALRRVGNYQSTRRNNPIHLNVQQHRRENQFSQNLYFIAFCTVRHLFLFEAPKGQVIFNAISVIIIIIIIIIIIC